MGVHAFYRGELGMKLSVLYALFPALLAGCVTQNYEQDRADRQAKFISNMNSWIGSPEDDLIRKWGAPHKTYSTNKAKFLTYSHSFQETVQGYGPTYMQRNIGGNIFSVPVGGMPSQTFQFSCEITWTIKNSTIDYWDARGNGCF